LNLLIPRPLQQHLRLAKLYVGALLAELVLNRFLSLTVSQWALTAKGDMNTAHRRVSKKLSFTMLSHDHGATVNMPDLVKCAGKGVLTAVSVGGACLALVTLPPVAMRLARLKLPNS